LQPIAKNRKPRLFTSQTSSRPRRRRDRGRLQWVEKPMGLGEKYFSNQSLNLHIKCYGFLSML
ncbi:hypothetical protein EGK_14631, partial [Macaca mulatta]